MRFTDTDIGSHERQGKREKDEAVVDDGVRATERPKEEEEEEEEGEGRGIYTSTVNCIVGIGEQRSASFSMISAFNLPSIPPSA